MIQYSFIEKPINNLHSYVAYLIPGIEKIVTIYLDEESNQLKSQLSERKKKDFYQTSVLDLAEISDKINELRKSQSPFEWYAKEDIPIKVNSIKATSPLTIFAERKNVVLLVKFNNKHDKNNDLIYLYFKENFGNFGLGKDDKWLTTENKTIIAKFISNAIRKYLEDKQADRDSLKLNSIMTERILSEIDLLKIELDRVKNNYGFSILKLCEQYLWDFGIQYKKTYHFTEGAIQKIKSYNGDLKDLQGIIEKTILYVNNMNVDKALVTISEWVINFENLAEQSEEKEIHESGSVYVKTIQLLDRMEKAAQFLVTTKTKITGVNIGKAMDKPISAPAISDALYNHKGKIKTLIKDHPDKWLTIRSEFRPLKNIIG